ncbi:hypothetical protein AVEN_119924-1 [Araneus ventricosus]|uniref:Uncharacterized protein n=1 Tax=Araneus ventricosus TaxID=182803 RepID=A0A4Y2SAA0_ARAVE|nr:hypothetical protein AVEN_119924-1 [Araneus ventricosus]
MFASLQNLAARIGFWQTAKFSEYPFFAQAFAHAHGVEQVRAFRHCLFCDHTNGNRPPNFEPWSDEEADTSARTVNSKRFSVLQALLHGCSSASAESGFEPGTLRHRSEILPPGQLGP